MSSASMKGNLGKGRERDNERQEREKSKKKKKKRRKNVCEKSLKRTYQIFMKIAVALQRTVK